jgi:hypothetical protein
VSLGNTDTGIFDFVIVNVPRAKVVIGTKPRADGKIPIVVQVPYKTEPLIPDDPLTTEDESKTDLQRLVPRITLSSTTSEFIDPSAADPSTTSQISPPNGITDCIPFGNQNDYQEAVYRIRAQAKNWQDYVVIAARDVRYYYVSASGNDVDPDYYNGGSESTPFKTLAYALARAETHNVDHIYVIGTLNISSEGDSGDSVFNVAGTPWPMYITGAGSNAVLQGTSGKRVVSVTAAAPVIFDNITIRGGSSAGNGGGVYIGGGSKVTWKSGVISGNQARSGGGVYVDNSEFDFMTGSITGNTATGATAAGFTGNAPDPAIDGGGGVYVKGDGQLWLAKGEITNNKTSGSGGGVLVNGSTVPDDPNDTDGRDDNDTPHNFIMSGGSITGNSSAGASWPHGGGGVFVAKGTFEMMSGRIMNNTSHRQGGGVFVWSRSLFYMDGDSSVTANEGVGSSKAICSRGITTMRGRSQADEVYVWNYAKENARWNRGVGDEFTLMEGARVSGLVLAFADEPQDNRNYINIVEYDPAGHRGEFFTGGTDPIANIDLESHLNANGSFSTTATIDGDWLHHHIIKNGGNAISSDVVKRFPLGTFTYGGATKSLSGHKLDGTGKLAVK